MNPKLPAVSNFTHACLGYIDFDFVCHLSRQAQIQEQSHSADTFATWLLCERVSCSGICGHSALTLTTICAATVTTMWYEWS